MTEATEAPATTAPIEPAAEPVPEAAAASSAAGENGADQAMLSYQGKDLPLKLVPATEGAAGVEISKLLTTLGIVTLDQGYTNTGSTTSAITYIDGDAGILRYRGYPI